MLESLLQRNRADALAQFLGLWRRRTASCSTLQIKANEILAARNAELLSEVLTVWRTRRAALQECRNEADEVDRSKRLR